MQDERNNELTRPMRRVEARLGRSLREYLTEAYALETQAEIAAALGISVSTVSRWMDRLGIETRFPGRRPEAVA